MFIQKNRNFKKIKRKGTLVSEKIAALITARGNNTMANKHLRNVCGKALIQYPIDIIKGIDVIDRFYISSDDTKILTIGKEHGFVPIVRPESLARPDSLHVDTIKHALDFMKDKDNYEPDILIVVLGNAVCIQKKWIMDSIKMLNQNDKLSAVVPVHLEQNFHPFRAKYIDENGILKPYFDFTDKQISSNRQDLPNNYFLCHNFWTLNVNKSVYANNGFKPWDFMGANVAPIIINKTIDVHDEDDIKQCEQYIKQMRM